MLAREEFDIETDVQSDTAPLHGLVTELLAVAGAHILCLKDPTRGGVATSLNEIALASEVSIARNIVFAHCVELGSRLYRLISIMNMRQGGYAGAIRKFVISSRGIDVAASLMVQRAC